jgi:hypothetical protein
MNLDNIMLDPETEEYITVMEYVSKLECRVKNLEQENIETSNCLYELMNTIDSLQWVITELQKKS